MVSSRSHSAWWRTLLPALLFASSTSAAAIKRQNQDPPQKPLKFNLTLADFNATLEKYLPVRLSANTEALKPSVEEATFENTVQVLSDRINEANLIMTPLYVYGNLGDTPELRQGVNAVFSRASEILRNSTADPNLYARLEKVYKQFEQDNKLDTAEGILAKGWFDSVKSAGAGFPQGPARDRFLQLGKEIGDNQDTFQQNVQSINTTMWFTREELDGVKSQDLDNLIKGEGENAGKFGIDLASTTDYSKVRGWAKRPDIRQNMSLTASSLVPENIDIFRETLGLRDERARLLNYTSFADSAFSGSFSMASSVTAVTDFLQDLQTRLYPKGQEELQEINEFAKQENATARSAFYWDSSYYGRLMNEKKYNLSSDTTNPWFPAENTVMEILKMYSDIYGFDFRRVEGDALARLSPTGKVEDLFWHKDVQLYAVWETVDPTEFVGYLYLDLYDRPGKAPGAYMFPLEAGYIKPDGDRHYPTTALGTNFKQARNASDTPALLAGGEMQTLFHELGHCMHQLSCRVRYAAQCGTNGTPNDFLEMPSQMMENYWYEPTVQRRLSKHWSYLSPAYLALWKKQNPGQEQPPESIPEDISNAVVQARSSQRALGELGQVFYGTYDMTLHTANSTEEANKTDTTYLYNKMFLDIEGFPGSESLTEPKNYTRTWGQTQFTHLMGGYEAGYYSYQWSKVYAKDIFYSKFKQNLFNGTVGRDYREKVLAPGGSKNLTGLFIDFLGRAPTADAFYKDLGIEA